MLSPFLSAILVVVWTSMGICVQGREQVTAVKREDRPRRTNSNLTSTSSLQPHILLSDLRNTTCP